MSNYLITGGAGFLGINLVRYLLERGQTVASLDMAPFSYPDAQERIAIHMGDIRDRRAVDTAMQGAQIVVHTAAALPLYAPHDILTTDVDGTRNVLDSAYQHGAQRVIHISSTAVYGVPDHHPLLEDDRLEGVGPYGKAKIAAENVCLEYRAKGLCVPILRPKSFIGPERLGVFALFYDWAREGKHFPILGSGKNRYQLLDVEDLCQAIYLAATGERAAANDTFNIGAKEFTTLKEDFQSVLDDAGAGKRIKSLPAAPAIAALRVLEALRLSPLYQWVYETASTDSFVSIDKAVAVLGFTPRYSNKDALRRNYRWYLDHWRDFDHQAGISHRAPWKQGALRLAKLFFS